jgi:hypothetical protein
MLKAIEAPQPQEMFPVELRRRSIAHLALLFPFCVRASAAEPLAVTKDLVLEKAVVIDRPIVVGASHITIDGNGATIQGPGKAGDPKSFAGIGISADGCSGVTIRNIKVRGFQAGLKASDGDAWLVEGSDFSGNFHDPEFGWGEQGRFGGMILTRISRSVIRGSAARESWNALDLSECDDDLIERNDLSHASNVCLKLWTSSRNQIIENDLSWGLRIKPGEVHARDSTCVLIESGSNENRFWRNDITHGGDGVFIRVLNGWVSTGNVFVENDCSWANNNCVESWSPGNTYIRNKANHGSYGFWLGAATRHGSWGTRRPGTACRMAFTTRPREASGTGESSSSAGPRATRSSRGTTSTTTAARESPFAATKRRRGKLGARTTGSCKRTASRRTVSVSGAAGATGSTSRETPLSTIPKETPSRT